MVALNLSSWPTAMVVLAVTLIDRAAGVNGGVLVTNVPGPLFP